MSFKLIDRCSSVLNVDNSSTLILLDFNFDTDLTSNDYRGTIVHTNIRRRHSLVISMVRKRKKFWIKANRIVFCVLEVIRSVWCSVLYVNPVVKL